MSNYTQTTFFTPKDSLPITDPNKTIFGAAYDVEFANIGAAMATKLDSVFTNPALISLNITGSATPANGFALPSANTLGFFINSTQVGSLVAATMTMPSYTVTGSTVPVNGIYLPSANTFGIAANTTQVATVSTSGMVLQGAAGGAKGAGTINTTGLFVNGVAAAGSSLYNCVGTTTTTPSTFSTVDTYITPTTFTVGANSMVVGSVFRAVISGTCTSSAANTVVVRFRIGPNGTTADSLQTLSFGSTAATTGTNIPFMLIGTFTVDAIGASASCLCHLTMINSGSNNGIMTTATQISVSTVHNGGFDSTVLNHVGISMSSGAATTSFQIISASMERLA